MSGGAQTPLPWVEPLEVAAGLRDQDGLLCLLSDGGPAGRYSFVAAAPEDVRIGSLGPEGLAEALVDLADGHRVALVAYDWGARPATGLRETVWPDLIAARYPTILVFDHVERRVVSVGNAEVAEAWLKAARSVSASEPPAETWATDGGGAAYTAAVADVVTRIGQGELFQANIARGWSGVLRPDADPFDLFVRLAAGAAPYGAYWCVGERALVSNSPELFLTFDPESRRIETRPIKGTRPRSADPAEDAARAAELIASEKDRAENLMIVDLMRNDLARVSEVGSVVVERLFELESFVTVHHLVSTVTGRAREGVGAGDILQAAFPPGSITGAPKHQAMKVIADHEPARGPWCGSLIHIGDAGRMTASVLIRTVALWRGDGRWRFRTQAGAGITAGSGPQEELAETEAKIAAIRRALIG
ncbi:anthranilate synthase component I family protein [Brevundimonas bacteroides]|uniref:anthranilate synthase component I family protein n=1 Tax=Brevundimonas bacteroides TaxID=74311 RepID=UPI00049666BD|nr:anthranilate synthase component I family protein [Brevundimonas bacteroides]